MLRGVVFAAFIAVACAASCFSPESVIALDSVYHGSGLVGPARLSCVETAAPNNADAIEFFEDEQEPVIRVDGAVNGLVLLCCSRPRLFNTVTLESAHFLVPRSVTKRYAMAYDYKMLGAYMAVCWQGELKATVGLLRWATTERNMSVPFRPIPIHAYTTARCPSLGALTFNPVLDQIHALLTTDDEIAVSMFTYNVTTQTTSSAVLLDGLFAGLGVDARSGEVLSVSNVGSGTQVDYAVVSIDTVAGTFDVISHIEVPELIASISNAPFYLGWDQPRALFMLTMSEPASSADGGFGAPHSSSSSGAPSSGSSGQYSGSSSSASPHSTVPPISSGSSSVPSSSVPPAQITLLEFDVDSGALVSSARAAKFGRHAVVAPMNDFSEPVPQQREVVS